MGMFKRRGVRVSFLLIAVTGLLLCGLRLAMGQSIPAKKNINIVTIYLSEVVEPYDAIRMEDSMGHDQIAPFLKARGYEVENVFSMHRLAASNGGLRRALITAFERDPAKDDARILVVTVGVEPGDEPYTVRTSFALLDSYVSGLISARKTGSAAQIDKIWDHESKAITAAPAQAAKEFGPRLNTALELYNGQFQPRTKN